MKRIIHIIFLSGCLLTGFQSAAQDLSPTVEVSRQYRGTLMNFVKPSVPMAVPDSVLRFNLEFDYSVFDNPFRGAYEFRPFLTEMELAGSTSLQKKLYLRAGAGYSLHPELDFVWTPLRNDSFRLSVYALHRSYVGDYRSLTPALSDGSLEIDSGNSRFYGYDLLSRGGVDGVYDWDGGIFHFDAGYYGTALKDTTVSRHYDGFDLKLGVASKQGADGGFTYRAAARYRYAEDNLDYRAPYPQSGIRLAEHEFGIDASAGGNFRPGHGIMIDFAADFASYGSAYDSNAASVALTPRYVFSCNRWKVDAGVKLALLLRNNPENAAVRMNTHKGQVVYPDVSVSFAAIREYMDIYLAAGGGPDINRYSALLDAVHRVSPLYNIVSGAPLLDNTVERFSVTLGLRGQLASRFRYDLSAGYRDFSNAPFDGWSLQAGTGIPAPAIGYSAARMFFALLDCSWNSQDVDFSGKFRYLGTDILEEGGIFAPPGFSGRVDFRYNWKRRIFVGADCSFATARISSVPSAAQTTWSEVRIPGYADLGVTAEYAFTRKFSLWLRGGNLLNMTIQRTPLYSESGIYFTAGICLNL